MPEIHIEVTDSGSTREISGKPENIYTIAVSGAKIFNLSYTPTEMQWKMQQLSDDMSRIAAKIQVDTSPLEPPTDTTADVAELKNLQQLQLLGNIVQQMMPRGALA